MRAATYNWNKVAAFPVVIPPVRMPLDQEICIRTGFFFPPQPARPMWQTAFQL